jgi:hypothetical protein
LPESSDNHSDGSTGSEASWQRSSAWLSLCTATHKSCNVERLPGSVIPTRFIDVGSESQAPRLCYSAEIKTPDPKYVTLSHCWGSLQLPKLTASTHDSLVNGIDIESLPKTFQDAIQFTRRLQTTFGVSYIWIDALCIFQDSPDDWRHEGSLMSDIYANAWCNIAAEKGADGTSGLFSPRDPQTVSILALDLNSDMERPYVFFTSSIWTAVSTSHLTKRAWVHQERCLSRRILHFTSQEIFWECQEHKASESQFWGEFSTWLDPSASVQLERTLLAPAEQIPWSEGILQQVWTSCVENFTKGKLSRAEDKLLAIAGLATRFHQRCPSVNYFAGLWDYELMYQLLWRRKEETTYPLPEAYRAPSWSWAAIDGQISLSWRGWNGEYGSNLQNPIFKGAKAIARIKKVSIETVAEDRFGQVRSGTLRLVGTIWKGTDIWGEGSDHSSHGSGEPKMAMKASAIYDIETQKWHRAEERKISVWPDGPIPSDKLCYSFPLFQTLPAVVGLLLQHSGQARGQFRRVGLFTLWREDLIWFRCLFSQPVEWDYEKKVGADKYMISVI